jgi:2-oxo-hept-3-ene-1,7-dioate hydratase
MLTESERHQAVDILEKAQASRIQAEQLSALWPHITFEDAYTISGEINRRQLAAGAKLVGYKVGLTSKAMQRSSQIDEPDYGYLLDHMMVPDGGKTARAAYCRPRVEVELAFVLGRPLKGPGLAIHDVLKATDYVVPAIEIVDARIKDPRKIHDTISDNGASAGLVLGGRPVRPDSIDLRWVGALLYRNGEIEETGVSAGVLGHPAQGAVWLANKLGVQDITLEAGHVVLTGSFTRVSFAQAGDTFHADFGKLGGVAVQFT